MQHTDYLFCSARYLSFADSVIVMNANGSIAEEGAPNDLRHKLDSINFGISGDSKRTNSRDKPSIIVQDKQLKNIFPKGPSDEDYQDLTRRTGDSTIYRYYFRSIGWKTALVFFSFSCTSAFSSYFPRKFPASHVGMKLIDDACSQKSGSNGGPSPTDLRLQSISLSM